METLQAEGWTVVTGNARSNRRTQNVTQVTADAAAMHRNLRRIREETTEPSGSDSDRAERRFDKKVERGSMEVPVTHHARDFQREFQGGNADMYRETTTDAQRADERTTTGGGASPGSAEPGEAARNDEHPGGNANVTTTSGRQIFGDVALSNHRIGAEASGQPASYATALSRQSLMDGRLVRELIPRWRRQPRVNVECDVSQALQRAKLTLNERWVTRITFNHRQLRRLERIVRGKHQEDWKTVKEVLSIHNEEPTWGIQCLNIASLRRKRVEIGSWVKSARLDMDDLDHHQEWREKVNSLYDKFKVDDYVYRAKIADTRGPSIRWRVKHEAKQEQQQQEPHIGESWPPLLFRAT